MAALRSGGRNLSYEILSRTSSVQEEEAQAGIFHRSNSDPIRSHDADHMPATPRRKRRKKKRTAIPNCSIPESLTADVDNGLEFNFSQTVLCSVTTEVVSDQNGFAAAELRQRTVNAGAGGAVSGETTPYGGVLEGEANAKEDSAVESTASAPAPAMAKPNGNLGPKLQTTESLDWQRVMAEDPNYMFSVDKSPLKYFMEEMSNGNSLRSTTTLGNEKERERVYDTIFRLPWRCELLIDVGFFVCFDSFLSLLTIMPTRILMTLGRLLHTRQFKRPSPAELSDFGCFTIMACGVILLEQTDISLIYHMIRGQGTIKLYVVYNVLEIFDKLCQSFNGDVLQTLFNSADGLASCPTENMRFWIWRFTCDQALAVTASFIHSFILLAQAITLSTCIVAHNNALFALLVSNNFAQIKSNVFKRYSKENIHSLVYFGEFVAYYYCLIASIYAVLSYEVQ